MTDFLHAPPGTVARRIADREIRGKASPGEVQWLHDNPALWARALGAMLEEVKVHTGSARLRLAQHPERPKAATHPSPGYLEAVAHEKRLQMARHVFQQKVEAKLRDVATLLGSARLVDRLVVGDLIITLHRITYLIEANGADRAGQLAAAFADALLREDAPPIPENY